MTTIVNLPKVTMNILGAQTPVENAEQRALIIGHKLSGGSASDGSLYSNIKSENIAAMFGLGSEIADTFDAFRTVNEVTPIDVIPVAESAGDAAVRKIVFTGAATASGSIEVSVGSERNGLATIAITSGDTNEDVVDTIVTAFSTKTKCVCTVTEDGVLASEAEVTYRAKGPEGNGIPVKITGAVAGLSWVISEDTAGTTPPTLPDVGALVGDTRYTVVIYPQSFGTAGMVTYLESLWNVANKILDSRSFTTMWDSSVSATNLIATLDALNEKQLFVQCDRFMDEPDYNGPSIFENPLARSAIVAGLRCLRLTTGENISNIVATNAPDDQIGGPALASLPFFNTPTPFPVLESGFGFKNDIVELLNDVGGFVVGNNTAFNKVLLGEVVSTYKTNSSGDPDSSFKNMEGLDTISGIREYMTNNIKADTRQMRLSIGDIVGGRAMSTAASIAGRFHKYYKDLGEAEYVLTVKGSAALAYFKENLTISIDAETGTVTGKMKCPVIVQLREIIVPIEISYSI